MHYISCRGRDIGGLGTPTFHGRKAKSPHFCNMDPYYCMSVSEPLSSAIAILY